LMQNQADFYVGSGPEAARIDSQAIDANQTPPILTVLGATFGSTNFVLKNELKGKDIKDLVSQPLKIGVSGPGSTHLLSFRKFLTDQKINEKDVKWQYVSMEAGNMVPALLSRQIDGFLHSEPTSSIATVNANAFLFMNARRGDFGDWAKLIPANLYD